MVTGQAGTTSAVVAVGWQWPCCPDEGWVGRMMATSLDQRTRSNLEPGIQLVVEDDQQSLAAGREKVWAFVARLRVRSCPIRKAEDVAEGLKNPISAMAASDNRC